jgi:hypothetical protein
MLGLVIKQPVLTSGPAIIQKFSSCFVGGNGLSLI